MADYPATGSLGWALPLKDYIDEEGGGGGATTYFVPESYGAVGDGVTDDTDAFVDCIAAAVPVSGTILLSAKTYGISENLQLLGVGLSANMVGMGQGSSVLKALGPDAGVSWGMAPDGPGSGTLTLNGRPSISSGWTFDGNLIATQGVLVGSTLGYGTWIDINSYKVDGDGWAVYPQNCAFITCDSNGNAGNGWTLDYGIQACEFINCHSSYNDGWDIEIRQSGGNGWGGSAQPQSLRFASGIVEGAGSPYFADTGLGGVHIREGTDITFERFELVAAGAALELTPSTANGYVGRIVVRDCRVGQIYLNANSGGVAQSMGGTNEPLLLEGWNFINEIVNGAAAPIYDFSQGPVASYSTEGTGADTSLHHTHHAKTSADYLAIWTEDGGTPLAWVAPDGTIYARAGQTDQVAIGAMFGFPGISIKDAYILRSAATDLFTNRLVMGAASASQVPTVSRGAASQTGDLFQAQTDAGVPLFSVGAGGVLKWDASANEQTTVGAAGGASAPPATPVKWLKVKDSTGATLVIPAYTA